MHIGISRFLSKAVAFRNDYCVRCRSPRIALCRRTLDMATVAAIFVIPVVPLGVYYRWHCRECDALIEPVFTLRRTARLVPMLLVASVGIVAWQFRPDSVADIGRWAVRIALALTLFVGVVWMARGDDEARRRERLAEASFPPLTSCPVCQIRLRPGIEWTCDKCGMVRA